MNSRFAEDGVNFSLNTDDTLVCQNDMRKEFCVAFNKMGFTAAMLAKAVRSLKMKFNHKL